MGEDCTAGTSTIKVVLWYFTTQGWLIYIKSVLLV